MRNEQVAWEGYTYGTCPNQSCLHEQQAITDLLASEPELAKRTMIVNQRDESDPVGGWGINTFKRHDHYDIARNSHLKYDNDQFPSRPKDFIQQCTGLASYGTDAKDPTPRNIRKECIEDVIEEVKQNFPAFYELEKKYEPVDDHLERISRQVEATFEGRNIPEQKKDLLRYATHNIKEEDLDGVFTNTEITGGPSITLEYDIKTGISTGTIEMIYNENTKEARFRGIRYDMSNLDLELASIGLEENFKDPSVDVVVKSEQDITRALKRFKSLLSYDTKKGVMGVISSLDSPRRARSITKTMVERRDVEERSFRKFLQKLDNLASDNPGEWADVYVEAMLRYLEKYGDIDDHIDYARKIGTALAYSEEYENFSPELVDGLIKLAEEVDKLGQYSTFSEMILYGLVKRGYAYEEGLKAVSKSAYVSQPLRSIQEAIPLWYKVKHSTRGVLW